MLGAVNTLNGLSLMVGAGIAVTDLLTDGALSRLSIVFVFAWAVSQAVGIEVQLLGSFARARQAHRNGSTGGMIGWLTLGVVLLAATIIAGYTYSVVRAENITTEAALAQLGISTFAFLGIRAFLAGSLVALSGWTRYVGKSKGLRSAEDEVAAIERQRKIEEAKAKLTQQRAKNAVRLGRTAINATFSREEPEDTEEGDDSPKAESDALDNAGEASATDETPTRNRGKKRIYSLSEERRFRRAKDNGSAQARVFTFLDRHPTAPLTQIMAATGVSKGTASKYKKAHNEHRAGARTAARG